KHEVVKRHAWRAGLGGVAGNSNFVSGLEGIPGKSGAGHLLSVAQFGSPMYHVSLIVCHIEQQTTVGIGPQPVRYHSLQRDDFIHLVGDTRSVVCHHRNRNDQENQAGVTHESSFHASPSVPNQVRSCFSSAVPTYCYVGVVHRTSSHLARIVGTALVGRQRDSETRSTLTSVPVAGPSALSALAVPHHRDH